jgi:hypothetical protein
MTGVGCFYEDEGGIANMGLFDPQWVKLLSPNLPIIRDYVSHLEPIRKRYSIPDEVFAKHIEVSPAGIQAMFELWRRGWRKLMPKDEELEIWVWTYAVFLAGANDVELTADFRTQLENIVQVHADRLVVATKVCRTFDELVKLFILEEGAYSYYSIAERSLFKEIDLACRWNGYAALGHLPPSFPKAEIFPIKADFQKLWPLVEEIMMRIAKNYESPCIVAYDVGTRTGAHPYQVILFFKAILDSKESEK